MAKAASARAAETNPEGVLEITPEAAPEATPEAAPTIVLVGGLSVLPREWKPLLERLAGKRRTVIVPRSVLTGIPNPAPADWDEDAANGTEIPQVPKQRADWEQEIEAIRRVMAAEVEKGGPVTLVGHSTGSLLAEGAARLYPELVGRLVMIDGTIPLGVRRGAYTQLPVSEALAKGTSKVLVLAAKVATSKPLRPLFAQVLRIATLTRGHHGQEAKELAAALSHPEVAMQAAEEFFSDTIWAVRLSQLQERPLPARVEPIIAIGSSIPIGLVQRWWSAWWRDRAKALRQQSVDQPGPDSLVVVHGLPRSTHMVMLSRPSQLGRILRRPPKGPAQDLG
ncbi:hypothetical protein BSR29_07510 [Boudabousia liubingyangii]|uniref:AB hydrolase-1 domain-containing protein n=1 Tax=Boudabousia liubingyangii TaxID=1921764 RepID=A0A1Q5PK96_9ACTO|nr:alpha/beta hydrolase [Boudabousia liubingyangii]OKL46654.1 hypothetical protein BSR29_07510 [Boudabousia liubingyangii]